MLLTPSLSLIFSLTAITPARAATYCEPAGLELQEAAHATTLVAAYSSVDSSSCPDGVSPDPTPPQPPEQGSCGSGTAQKKHLSLWGAQLEYVRYASGNPNAVIFFCGGPGYPCASQLPGIPGDTRPRNIPSNYDVIVFDYPGLGANLRAPKGHATAEGVAELAAKIVQSEGLTHDHYVLYGHSWGSEAATIAASLLGANPPKSVVLEGTVGKTTEHAEQPAAVSGEQIKSSILAQAAGLPDADKTRFGATLDQVLGRLGTLGSEYQQIVLMFFGSRIAQLGPSFTARASKWTVPQVEACLKKEAEETVADSQDPVGRKLKRAHDRFYMSASCASPYDSANYQIPSTSVIYYVSGDADTTTPPAQAEYHRDHQASVPLQAKLVSVLSGVGHTDFNEGPGKFSCECDSYIWDHAFTDTMATDLSHGPGCPSASAAYSR